MALIFAFFVPHIKMLYYSFVSAYLDSILTIAFATVQLRMRQLRCFDNLFAGTVAEFSWQGITRDEKFSGRFFFLFCFVLCFWVI